MQSVVKSYPALKTRLILNPRSGRAARALPAVRDFARANGASLVETARAGHTAELARQALADGCQLIVSVGGDGTMNEIAGVLAGTPATLGLVPCGSGDGLGRQLGIHGPIPRALAILSNGHPRLIDGALADGHPFFTVAGLGFEAEIARRFNLLRRRGFLRYLSTAASTFRAWRPQDFVVTRDGQRTSLHAFTLAVANAAQYGNNALIAPGARLDDGLLDLTAVPPISATNSLPLVLRLFRGTLARSPNVVLQRGARFVVERPEPGPLHTDGEVHSAGTRVEFSVRPACLRVMTPA